MTYTNLQLDVFKLKVSMLCFNWLLEKAINKYLLGTYTVSALD